MRERVLYLEPVGGIAGDMFLAAAVDLGVSARQLEKGLESLGLPAWHLVATPAQRHTLSGVHVEVVVEEPLPAGHRPLSDILRRIESSTLPERAKERARSLFLAIGRVEASIHGVPLEEVEFHEVGAVDSIVDVCGAALVLEYLGNPTVCCGPVPLGAAPCRRRTAACLSPRQPPSSCLKAARCASRAWGSSPRPPAPRW